ncbi:MAG: hypothetical protein I3273_06080 [Candidatus Moeniiplasma glomeromycotorum]|nr:hypothetical protein [Candidatus Moeniiplasma glomeromycotorum]MCE8169653.1 hypothetical protein [Candidatus Moeniiplasma glomeromycotorum]
MYTLKPSFETNCFQCQKKLVVNFCPPRQNYSNKNHWGYWTGQKEKQGQYICDACLTDIYQNHKQNYLNSITDSKKRRTFRAYFGGKVKSLGATLWEQLVNRELSERLRREGVNLDKSELDDYLENWRRAMLKLIQENSLQAEKIKELEKNQKKKKKQEKGQKNI